MLIAAVGDVDASTRGRVTSVEGNAGAIVVILEVGLDPGGGEGTGTLEGQGSGIEEVVDVKVSKLHSHGLADTGSLVVGHGGVDDLQAVQLTGALAHDGVNTDGTDTVATGSTSNDDGDGVGTRSKVNTAMAVLVGVVGVMGADHVIGMMAVISTNQRSLEDELAVIVNRESITGALQVSETEDSRANSDKVVGLANSGTGSTEVELVPAAIDVELNWAAVSVVIVVMAVIMVAMVVALMVAAGALTLAAGAAAALAFRAA